MARHEPVPSSTKFITLAAICVVVGALYWAQEVLIPLALAVLFTFLLTPLVRRLERFRVPRVPAVLAVVLSAFLALLVLGYVVGVQLYELANNIDQYKDNISAKVEVLKPSKGGLFEKWSRTAEEMQDKLEKPPATTQATQPAEVLASEVASRTGQARTVTEKSKDVVPNPATQPTAENPLPVAIVEPKPSPFEQMASYLGLALGPLGTAGLVIVFALFMLLQREDLRNRLIRLVGYGRFNLTTQALDDVASRISRYLVAQAIVNGTYGVAIAIGLWVIGATAGRSDPPFPNVVLWGLLCAVLRFIPYIGPWIAAAFPIQIGRAHV